MNRKEALDVLVACAICAVGEPCEGCPRCDDRKKREDGSAICKGLPNAEVLQAVEEVRKIGKWKKAGNKKECSECGFIYYSGDEGFPLCPICGVEMEVKR